MKKLVLVLAVAFSASLFSCNNAAKEEAANVDTVAVVEEAAVVEEVPVDTTAAAVEAPAENAEAPAAEEAK